jgi:hypothetical protein
MKRPLIASTVLCLTALAVLAADSKVDSAVTTFKSVESDAGKLKIFCEMSSAMDKAGDNPDAAADTKIDGYMKQLGPDFATAWNAGEGVDENSADGKKLNAALDELGNKCS